MDLGDVPSEPESMQAKAHAEQEKGLLHYHDSLTKSALAKYDIMLHLLGETSDWSAPGSACEAVIAEVLRSALPGRLSVDKGFIFGRRVVGTTTAHCPEIDLLVHDSCEYSPLCRIGGYVVVDPASVRAIIQVKRTATSGQIAEGIRNVIEAKDHLCRSVDTGPRISSGEVFSAVVALGSKLERKDGGLSKTYENRINEAFSSYGNHLLMPHFVGCLGGAVLLRSGELYGGKVEYSACNSNYKGDAGSLELGFSLLLLAMRRAMQKSAHGVLATIPSDVPVTHSFQLALEKQGGE
jgi:hypothetical protein